MLHRLAWKGNLELGFFACGWAYTQSTIMDRRGLRYPEGGKEENAEEWDSLKGHLACTHEPPLYVKHIPETTEKALFYFREAYYEENRKEIQRLIEISPTLTLFAVDIEEEDIVSDEAAKRRGFRVHFRDRDQVALSRYNPSDSKLFRIVGGYGK